MKRFLQLCALALVALPLLANHAVPKPASVRAATPNQLDVRLHGDEFYHYNTTADGYTLLRGATGQWEYARQHDGRLVSTGVAASNIGNRTAVEKQLIAQLDKRLVDQQQVQLALQNRKQAHPQRVERFNYNRFRGLIILVEYTDLSFEMSNPQDFYNHMVNDHNYTGYTMNGKHVACTGSVRDYYYDQSGGLFDPVFDVVGPVKVNYKSTDHRATSGSASIFSAALSAVDSQVDFTQYDGDDDGTVDMVFFIGAGAASCYEGNDDNLLWPHKHMFILQSLFTRYDGMRVYDYACATEIYGWQDTPSSLETQGVGVICHEFSHVLGLQDHYDADYDGSGGECHTPGWWDIMADGPTTNAARTPPSYNLYERWSLGWCNPTIINHAGTYTLRGIDGTLDGCIMRTPSSDEYFTFENRQPNKWDKYLPGHGMIVMRVDSADALTAWSMNKVNVNPSHMHFEMRRAWNNTALDDLPSDPFPGTKNINKLTNTTSPNLKTWTGSNSPYCLWNIQEKNGVITFEALPDGQTFAEKRDIETFDKLPIGLEAGTPAVGDLATWVTAKATVASYGGSRKVALTAPSTVTSTTPLYYDAYRITIDAANTASSPAKLSLYYSLNGGTSWTLLKDAAGTSQLTVAAKGNATLEWDVNFAIDQAVLYRVALISGGSSDPCYVDNFTVYYNGEPGTPISTDPNLIETFDKLPLNLASGTEAVGDIATWRPGNATIASHNGSRQVAMTLPSTMQTVTPLYYATNLAVLTATNPQTTDAKLTLYTSVNDGATWTPVPVRGSSATQLTVPAGESVKGIWDLSFTNQQPVLYRFAMVSGSKTAPCYVDNFTLYYTGEPGTGREPGDVNGDGRIDIDDVNLLINIILELNTDADLRPYADINGDTHVDIDDVNLLINKILSN